jgi:predicted RNase H-like HicB family nuclease
MVEFVGILDGGGDVWGVRFPDMPGCVGGGATPEEAIADATAALRDVVAHKIAGGHALPVASAIAAITKSGEVAHEETVVLIPVVINLGRTVRANLTFDAGLLSAIDQAAVKSGLTRSAFLASAALEKIEGRR